MKNDLEDIDLIIRQKLTGPSLHVPESEWSIIGKKLSFYNFFKFGLYHINIYYLIVFTFLASASGYAFIQNYKLKTHIKNLEKTIYSIKKDEAQSTNSTPIINKVNNEPSTLKEKDFHFSNTKKVNKTENDNTKILLNDTTKVKALPVIQKEDSVFKNKQVNKRVLKKKVYIKNSPVIIRDTIIKYQTTR